MTKSTIYQTPTGESKTGYIIDGKTYQDPQGKKRVELGSVVPTEGGTFLYTGHGGVRVPSSIGDGIQKGYDDAKKSLDAGLLAQQQAIDSKTERELSAISAERDRGEKNYEDLNRKAQSAYISASNPYGAAEEQRARIGLANSGYAESSKMKLANAYQSAISENERAKLDYMNELDRAYREARSRGDEEKARAIADYERLVYTHGIEAAEALANQQKWAYEAAMSYGSELWNRAFAFAKAGLSNEEIAETLGLSLSEVQRIANGG